MSAAPTTAIDHLVVAAASLDEGAAWCEAVLGVAPRAGGRHGWMGTHNRLLRLDRDGAPPAYLEIISIDPDAPRPGRPRWFGLDTADLTSGPRLLHWVARGPGLEAAQAVWRSFGFELGPPRAASRDTPAGRLAWRLTVRDDGALLAGGAAPTLIEWGAVHPCDAMPAAGLRLASLELRGLPASSALLADWLATAGATPDASPGPALTATLDTPSGRVVLASS